MWEETGLIPSVLLHAGHGGLGTCFLRPPSPQALPPACNACLLLLCWHLSSIFHTTRNAYGRACAPHTRHGALRGTPLRATYACGTVWLWLEAGGTSLLTHCLPPVHLNLSWPTFRLPCCSNCSNAHSAKALEAQPSCPFPPSWVWQQRRLHAFCPSFQPCAPVPFFLLHGQLIGLGQWTGRGQAACLCLTILDTGEL